MRFDQGLSLTCHTQITTAGAPHVWPDCITLVASPAVMIPPFSLQSKLLPPSLLKQALYFLSRPQLGICPSYKLPGSAFLLYLCCSLLFQQGEAELNWHSGVCSEVNMINVKLDGLGRNLENSVSMEGGSLPHSSSHSGQAISARGQHVAD